MGNKRISYFMHNQVGGYFYGPSHPMKPHRLCLTHNLNIAYGLYRQMNVYRSRRAQPDELRAFHTADYIHFLSRITPDNVGEYSAQMRRFNVSEEGDCPTFDGLFDFCQLYTGGSIDGARLLMGGNAEVAVNWAGGLHHAKKAQASGFCYVNDIVLSILELLKFYPRVLYIDIDVHHGDGVEEAFYATNRVMTCSFHKFAKDFFPESGDVWDTGHGEGRGYAVNVPLKRGITDAAYTRLFKRIIARIMDTYRPGAVVLQCGADSLAHDPIGDFNLTLKGHGECVRYVKGFGIPTLVLGGGGYNIRSVARCWAYETALLLGTTLEDAIPYNDYWSYFEADHKLHFAEKSGLDDHNSQAYLDGIAAKVFDSLRDLDVAPSVQVHDMPPNLHNLDEDDDAQDPDARPVVDQATTSNEFFNHDNDQGM